MAYFWFDDSIHPRGGFALGAFAASLQDESPLVARIARHTGVGVSSGEFKSGARMAADPQMRRTRDILGRLLAKRCKILLTAVPYDHRNLLGRAGLDLLRQALACGVIQPEPHHVYFDQGLDIPNTAQHSGFEHVHIHRQQDSRFVAGIQLADLAAHTLSMILLQRMGFTKKVLVGAGPEWGYDLDTEIDLAFALWAPFRYNFLSGGLPPVEELQRTGDMTVTVEGYGLHIPVECTRQLTAALRQTFGKCYLGCMH